MTIMVRHETVGGDQRSFSDRYRLSNVDRQTMPKKHTVANRYEWMIVDVTSAYHEVARNGHVVADNDARSTANFWNLLKIELLSDGLTQTAKNWFTVDKRP
jgi:hypothetical protein